MEDNIEKSKVCDNCKHPFKTGYFVIIVEGWEFCTDECSNEFFGHTPEEEEDDFSFVRDAYKVVNHARG